MLRGWVQVGGRVLFSFEQIADQRPVRWSPRKELANDPPQLRHEHDHLIEDGPHIRYAAGSVLGAPGAESIKGIQSAPDVDGKVHRKLDTVVKDPMHHEPLDVTTIAFQVHCAVKRAVRRAVGYQFAVGVARRMLSMSSAVSIEDRWPIRAPVVWKQV